MEKRMKERMGIATRNLKEHIGDDLLKNCLMGNGIFHVYWGTAPTGRPHIAYFLPMSKIADFLKSGCEVTILFADLHAFLDDMKTPWEVLDKRTEYYEIIIKGVLKALSVDLNKLKFIRGTDFQLSVGYTASVFKIIELTSVHDAIKAGTDVVKQNLDPCINSLIYPLLQSLDEEFLGVDAQFGGYDQRKIFMYAREYLPKLDFPKRIHLMNSMIPGLKGAKMSASNDDSKIDLLDDPQTVKRKIDDSLWFQSPSTNNNDFSENNFLSGFLKYVIWPNMELLKIPELCKYENYADIENDIKSGKMNEQDIKNVVQTALCLLMKDLKNEFTRIGKENILDEAFPTQIPHIENHVKEGHQITQFQKESLQKVFPNISKISNEKFPLIVDKPTVLWSCRIVGKPGIEYLVPLKTLAEVSKKDWRVIILIEDIGTYLLNKGTKKLDWNLLDKFGKAYRKTFKSVFNILNGNAENLKIICGSEFQLTREYALLMYQYLSRIKLKECTDMVKKMVGDKPDVLSKLSSIIYPCISIIDQVFLKTTIRLFGENSFVSDFDDFAYEFGKRLDETHKVPILVTHKRISLPGNISISMLEKPETLKQKVRRLYFNVEDINNNPVLDIIELIIYEILNEHFKVERKIENGGDIAFSHFNDIKVALANNTLHPEDVKMATVKYLVQCFRCRIDQNLDNLYLSLEEDNQKVTINKGDFNPNDLDIKIALVEKITYQKGSYEILLLVENKIYTFNPDHIYSLTPKEYCLVAMYPSTDKHVSQVNGILCMKNVKGFENYAIKVNKKTISNNLTFANFDPILPHLKKCDSEHMVQLIEENIIIEKGKIKWRPNNAIANVESLYRMDGWTNVLVKRI